MMEVLKIKKIDILNAKANNNKTPLFSDEMLEALAEAEDIEKHPEKYKSYNSVEDLMKDIHNEIENNME